MAAALRQGTRGKARVTNRIRQGDDPARFSYGSPATPAAPAQVQRGRKKTSGGGKLHQLAAAASLLKQWCADASERHGKLTCRTWTRRYGQGKISILEVGQIRVSKWSRPEYQTHGRAPIPSKCRTWLATTFNYITGWSSFLIPPVLTPKCIQPIVCQTASPRLRQLNPTNCIDVLQRPFQHFTTAVCYSQLV